MIPRKKPGTCLLCRAEVSKKAALQHTSSCLLSSGWPTGLSPSFIIRIDDRQKPSYWLTVLAKHSALASDLDHLLRDVWMGSGTENSTFTLQGTTYASTQNGMDIPLANLLEQGSSFTYDYGTHKQNHLRLRVQETTPVMMPEGVLCLIARNMPFFPRCSVCGDDAEFVASETGEDEEEGVCYCLKCLMDLDQAFVHLIENTPRKSVCACSENLNEMVSWYPPGWSILDLASPDKLAFMMACEDGEDGEDEWTYDEPADGDEVTDIISDAIAEIEDEMAEAISAVMVDIGDEIAEFFGEERDSYGEDAAILSKDMVMVFCTLQYGLYEKTIDEWDVPLMRMCLPDIFVEIPGIPNEWQKNVVPILCRFLTWMEANGRITNAAVLSAALQEAELQSREIAMSRRDGDDRRGSLTEQTMAEETDEETFHTLGRELVQELQKLFPADQTPEEYRAVFESVFGKNPEAVREDVIRYEMIHERCEDFCTRLDNGEVPGRCKEMIIDLAAHPDEPMKRGDSLLWSAALVYAVCREEGIMGRAKGGSPLAREISEYFNLELSAIRNKVTVLRKLLAECDDMKPPFSI